MKTFDIKKLYKDSWELLEKHIVVILGSYVITGLFIVGSGLLMDEQSVTNIPATILLSVLSWIIIVTFSLGIFRILLDAVEGKDPKIETLWSKVGLVPEYIGLSVLQGIIIFLGFFLLFFPAIIFALMFSLSGFALVHRNGGILESLVESKNLTRGYKWNLLLVFIILVALNIVGALLFGIGLIVTIPFTHIVIAHIYTELRTSSN